MAEQMKWDEVNVANERVTEEDIKAAESMGLIPIGKFRCVCVGSAPREIKFEDYSCFAANLKWEIEDVLEINGQKPTDEEMKSWEGRFIWDSVNLEHHKEKDGFKKRRVLIAKRCGLISSTSQAITKDMWAKDIIGRQIVLVTKKQDDYIDKKSKLLKTGQVRVAFDGYEALDGENAGGGTTDTFADI